MAVDEKYVETVGEEKEEVNYDDVLAEFGAEANFVEDESIGNYQSSGISPNA